MDGIPVFIRDIDEADGVPIGLLDPMHLESLVTAVKLFGGYSMPDGTVRRGNAFGQFVLLSDRAFFEVVIDGEAL